MGRPRRQSGRYGEEVVAFRGIPHIAEVAEERRVQAQGGREMVAGIGATSARGSITVSLGLRTIESLGKLMIAFGENRGRVIDRAVAELAERELKEE